MAFESANATEIDRVPSRQSAIGTTRMKTWWLSRGAVRLMVPFEIEDGALVSLAKAKTLNPRMENVPHIDELIVTSTGHEISTWTEFNAVNFTLVTNKLKILTHQFRWSCSLGHS